MMKAYYKKYDGMWEAAFWLSGFIFLALIDPSGAHLSICPLHYLEVYCPGCGLGRSISYLLHGEVLASFQTHPLGVVATLILGHRTLRLGIASVRQLRKSAAQKAIRL